MRKIAIVLALLFVSSALLLFACSEEPNIPTDENVLSILHNSDQASWKDDNYESDDNSNPNRGKRAFTLAEGNAPLSTIKSNKFTAYDSLSMNVSNIDLMDYKKLVVTAKGANELVVQIVCSPALFGGWGYDSIRIPLSDSYQTYEFDISFDSYDFYKKNIQAVAIYPNFGIVSTGVADISIVQLEFSKEAPRASKVLNTESVLPDDTTDGIKNPFSINNTFLVNGTETWYTISRGQNGNAEGVITNKFTINRANPGWAYVYTSIKGNLKGYTKINIKFKGSEGLRAKMKLQDGPKEIETVNIATADREPNQTTNADGKLYDFLCTGEVQEFTWSDFTDENLIESGSMRFMFFLGANEQTPAGYTFEVFTLEFVK